ncbi:hypothetical protein Droror1_Dr00019282 [Drosera rotundifolia]
MSSQHAVTIVRKELMIHNDPERCSRVLVREALKLDACDNLTVIVACFSSEPPPRIEMHKSRFRKSISTEGLNLLQKDLIVNQQRGDLVLLVRLLSFFLQPFLILEFHEP